MRIYNIYLDRIEISFDGDFQGPRSLEYKLVSLSSDLLSFYQTLPLGRGITYRRLSELIESLVSVFVFSNSSYEVPVVGVLRNALSFLRRSHFPDFQINILNHV